MLRETESATKRKIAGVIRTSLRGGINQICHGKLPNALLPRSNSSGPSDCVINLILCFYCQVHNVQQLIRPAKKIQTNLNPHYDYNQSGLQQVDSGASTGGHLYHCQSMAEVCAALSPLI